MEAVINAFTYYLYKRSIAATFKFFQTADKLHGRIGLEPRDKEHPEQAWKDALCQGRRLV